MKLLTELSDLDGQLFYAFLHMLAWWSGLTLGAALCCATTEPVRTKWKLATFVYTGAGACLGITLFGLILVKSGLEDDASQSLRGLLET